MEVTSAVKNQSEKTEKDKNQQPRRICVIYHPSNTSAKKIRPKISGFSISSDNSGRE
jgi:hypothetical protein